MISSLRQDRGQTLPMYVVVVGGLLFLAFAYFAFAQAAAARNGGQSAADAAALAAAQEVRDELTDGFIRELSSPERLIDWLDGRGAVGSGEAAATQLAGENDSTLLNLTPTPIDGNPAFTAEIRTNYTVGDSIIPGTENNHARANATAVIEPRCNIRSGSDPLKLIEIDCEGGVRWEIDPKDIVEADLPYPNDLFSVHLAE
ncbi:pilus assembly protein TadG-related protein [Streptomyces albidochromogenes]|uniref:Pilus assembly protein TadG-related protein n=1 Tax=Streptomyces albidochromogenes TaxID=329524 RepID=A0ABW6FNK0_9ACTN